MLRKLKKTEVLEELKKQNIDDKKTEEKAKTFPVKISIAKGGELKIECESSRHALCLMQEILKTNDDKQVEKLHCFLATKEDPDCKCFYIARSNKKTEYKTDKSQLRVDQRLSTDQLSKFGTFLTEKGIGIACQGNKNQKEIIITLLGLQDEVEVTEDDDHSSLDILLPGLNNGVKKTVHAYSGGLYPGVQMIKEIKSTPQKKSKVFSKDNFIAILNMLKKTMDVPQPMESFTEQVYVHTIDRSIWLSGGKISFNKYQQAELKWTSIDPLRGYLQFETVKFSQTYIITIDPTTKEISLESLSYQAKKYTDDDANHEPDTDIFIRLLNIAELAKNSYSTTPVDATIFENSFFPGNFTPSAKLITDHRQIQQTLENTIALVPDDKQLPSVKNPPEQKKVVYSAPLINEILKSLKKMCSDDDKPLVSKDGRRGVLNGIGISNVSTYGSPGLNEQFALTWVMDESDNKLKLLMSYQGNFDYCGQEGVDDFNGNCLISFDTENQQITTEIIAEEGRSKNFNGDTVINFLMSWADLINNKVGLSFVQENNRNENLKSLIARLSVQPGDKNTPPVILQHQQALNSCPFIISIDQAKEIIRLIDELQKQLNTSIIYDAHDKNYIKRKAAIDTIAAELKTEDTQLSDKRSNIVDNLKIVLNNKPSWKEKRIAFQILDILSVFIIPVVRYLFYKEPATNFQEKVKKLDIPPSLILSK